MEILAQYVTTLKMIKESGVSPSTGRYFDLSDFSWTFSLSLELPQNEPFHVLSNTKPMQPICSAKLFLVP